MKLRDGKLKETRVSEGGGWGPHWELSGTGKSVYGIEDLDFELTIRGWNNSNILTFELSTSSFDSKKPYKKRGSHTKVTFEIPDKMINLLISDIDKFVKLRNKRLKK